ncbi:glutathione ABC transporter permease GsiC [Thioclava sp. SK-1]|uniref:ABC transporter permease n=1 Tax=Thioclava sp. SK-1 TaxID=1889770 RepID=UPI0008247B50|nr:ABC transporter permease [Thioclava sp. SK-1]OCX58178.1 glutathione ABC transporter permease GsiC [Thioclava sp. SK-1]
MLRYIAKRIGIAVVLVWLVSTLVFLVLHLVPGDPATMLLSSGDSAPDPSAVAELRRQMGLDQPIMTQYGAYLLGVVQGDFGASLRDGTPIAPELLLRLPRTLELILAATFIASLLGIPLGTLAAMRDGGLADRVVSIGASLSLSTPVFVVGTAAILIFAQKLGWISAGGYVPLAEDPLRHVALLLLPAGTIALSLWAVIVRMTRASVLEVLERDYVRTARAKGVPRMQILSRHVVRNAMVPVVTVIGLQMGNLLGSTVLIEYVFNWPGLSGYLVRAVEARDYPEVVGIVLLISIIFVLLNLLVDIAYAVLDPRVKLTR